MKLTFIRPNMTATRSPSAMQPLAFAVLAGLTPPDIEMDLIDECLEPVPEKITTDLAAITVQTFTAARSYQIADRLRECGTPVVMGGYHPTFMPDEALCHADCVVIGEAEPVWKDLLNDFQSGKLKKIYNSHETVKLDNLVFDRALFRNKKYIPFVPVQFSRGCSLSCEFCSVNTFFNHRHRYRPISDIIAEIKTIKTKALYIVDDSMFLNPPYISRLLEELIPLKKKWWCQIDIRTAYDDTQLALMAKSGCIAAMVGFESLDIDNLRQMNKSLNLSLSEYGTAVQKIKNHGIMVYGSFVFGYDHETPDTIEHALDFVVKNKFFLNNFNTLNPLPGTRLYERLKTEEKLLCDTWWLNDKYKYGEVAFQPARMTPEALKFSCIKARFLFNSYRNILKRLMDFKANARNIINICFFVVSNLIARREIQIKMSQLKGVKSFAFNRSKKD